MYPNANKQVLGDPLQATVLIDETMMIEMQVKTKRIKALYKSTVFMFDLSVCY